MRRILFRGTLVVTMSPGAPEGIVDILVDRARNAAIARDLEDGDIEVVDVRPPAPRPGPGVRLLFLHGSPKPDPLPG